jgi:tRNA nucleotidyltransferase (CCA-adding enzyme)
MDMLDERILREILPIITPTEKERYNEGELIRELMTVLKAVIKKTNPDVDPMLVGSIAKGTDLKGDKDIDVFIQFPKKTKREKLEAQGLKIGRDFFDLVGSSPEINYAEHPYVKGKYHKFLVEIVPCYNLEKGRKIISAVDRTPLHTEYVTKKVKKNPFLRAEIRLLKRFMKANGLYGANASVEGFSGYLCELLTIKYGSFLEVIKAASKWKKHEEIFITKRGKKKFGEAPLTFIDPVDENRNVAAAVSVEKLAYMIYLSNSFLSEPDAKYFYDAGKEVLEQKAFYSKLAKRGTELICILFNAPKLIEDTLVPQLSKSLRAVVHESERAGFKVMKARHWTDGKHVAFLIEFEVWELPRVMKKQGPFFDSDKGDMQGFIKSNKTKALSHMYLEGDHWIIEVERPYLRVVDLIKHYLKDPKGFGKDLREIKRFDIKENASISDIKVKEFWEFMDEFW